MSKKTQDNMETTILKELQQELDIKNAMDVPRIKKVCINVGVGSYLTKGGGKDPSVIVENIEKITGQKPIVTQAKKAISNFKLRAGMPVGVAVTLRGEKMNAFIQKLVHIVLPRVRDFRGITKKGFDGNGNYNLGFKEHLVFPEINPDDITKTHGIEVTIVTSAKNNEDAYKLLLKYGFPFKEAAKN